MQNKKNTLSLFQSYNMKNIHLNNRFVMAPMTRSRSSQPGDIPNDLMATYYKQRSSAGLIVTEATQISKQGKGYARTPGIYTKEQVEGWQKVTEAVHQNGSKIFVQLWHVGRVSSSKVNGLQPLAPSAIMAKDTSVYIFENKANGDATFVPVEVPKEMTLNDIEQVTIDYEKAAENALLAHFDGVEIHAANGYLLDQFLRTNSNHRMDEYGGTTYNRIRLLLEITQNIVFKIGKEKVGVRLSPFIKYKDMEDPNILETILLAADYLNKLDIAYIHLCEADWDDAPEISMSFRKEIRKRFKGTIIVTGNKTPEIGDALIRSSLVDLVGFGRRFISNPDFPERIKMGMPLSEIKDNHTLFGGGDSRGYTDYPKYK